MDRIRFVRAGSSAIVIAAVGLASSAHAQSVSDKAAAEALFDQGRKLLAEGKLAEACPKLAESNRLDSGIGTMLYLADCYERSGLTASAWVQFREAAAAAARKSDPRERVARERVARLEAKLSKLAVTVNASDTPGLEVKRDGEPLSRGIWGTELPIDPGAHTIVASAPGKKPWQSTVQIGASAAVTVAIPPLEDAAVAAASRAVPVVVRPGAETHSTPIEPDAPATSRGNGQRVAGLVIGGVGIVGLGVGAFFGLQAKSHLDDSNADNHCHDGNKCDDIGRAARSDAQSAATISTIAFIAGGVAVAGGAVLYLTAPKGATRIGFAPAVGPREQGVLLRGVW